jgi:hypothetical protein
LLPPGRSARGLIRARPAGFRLLQKFNFERLQALGQSRTPLHDLPGADQAKGRLLGEPLGVVDILIIRAK